MTVLRACLALIIAASALSLVLFQAKAPQERRGPAEQASRSVPVLPDIPELASLEETRVRPLFEEDRRVPVFANPQTGHPPPGAGLFLGRYAPIGAMALGPTPRAMLRNVEKGEIVSVREGDRLGDWVVRQVTLDQLVLQKGEQTEILHFRRNSQNR